MRTRYGNAISTKIIKTNVMFSPSFFVKYVSDIYIIVSASARNSAAASSLENTFKIFYLSVRTISLQHSAIVL
ncbi:MAG TPA: hypothetical protein DCY17_04120 [Clostridiales bacterium]|nr:hypothetical protein [Clostridiales bacterium]